MGLKQYRNIDLTVLFVIMSVIEVASGLVLSKAMSSYYLSVIMVVTLIVYMRWGFWGAIFGFAGGIMQAILILNIQSAVDPNAFEMQNVIKWSVAYVVGYLATMFSMFFFKIGKKKLSEKLGYIFLYVLSSYLLMAVGRSIALAFFGQNFFNALMGQTRELLNLVFTFLVLLVAKRQDSVFADQKEYFETHKVRR